jgi:hypothetical protein
VTLLATIAAEIAAREDRIATLRAELSELGAMKTAAEGPTLLAPAPDQGASAPTARKPPPATPRRADGSTPKRPAPGRPASGSGGAPGGLREEVLRAVKDGCDTAGAVRARVGVQVSVAQYHLQRLVKAGEIQATGKTSDRRYRIAAQASPAIAAPRGALACTDCGTELREPSPDGRCGFCTEDDPA